MNTGMAELNTGAQYNAQGYGGRGMGGHHHHH
jgi:hypothetical protein